MPLLWNVGFRWVREKEGDIRQVRQLMLDGGGDPEIWYTRGTLRFASVTNSGLT